MILDETNKPITCSHCESGNVVRAGKSRNKQRYFCKDCGTYFVNKTLGKSKEAVSKEKVAMLLYLSGAQIKDLEQLFGVSYPTIVKWIKPAQIVVELNSELKNTLKARKKAVTSISTVKDIPSKPKKHWLILELDEDFFRGKSIILS